MPYVGASAGVLDVSGIGTSRPFYLTGSLGVKYAIAERFSLYTAGTLHWASEPVFDFQWNDDRTGGEADHTDVTIDAGVRFYF
jgi:hypothetical protein